MRPDITSATGILSRKIRISFLTLIFIGLGGLPMAWPEQILRPFDPLMTIEDFKKLDPEKMVLIDTRSSLKYLFGHIPRAVRIANWKSFTETRDAVPGLLIQNREWIAKTLNRIGINSQKTIVIYGDPKDSWRTDGRFFWMFHFYGFKQVALLEGGYSAWIEFGGEVRRGKGEQVNPTSLSASDIQINPDVTANQSWIQKRLFSSNLALIDNRTRKEYDGATPYGSVRGGHIPNSVHIDWRDLFNASGRIKKKNTLIKQLKSHGITIEKEVVVYCTGGVRSAMAYFVLTYLGFQVRNYDGSWWDWSHNPKLPIES